MRDEKNNLLNEIAGYYSNKLAEYGKTPHGVDWNGEASQILRFEQLCKIIHEDHGSFSLNDLGCGYGALLDYLETRFSGYSYVGADVSEDMVHAAESSLSAKRKGKARFIVAAKPDIIADYGIASGIFNVRLQRTDDEWYHYLCATLDILNETSRLSFSFNCLTSYSDKNKKRADLYYADPCKIFDLCKRRYSSQIGLLHDYGLYEFTILVRKYL